ncbi:MAG TPA: methionyl-tRNA formyltransferase [Sphingomonas sp.]|nr:methionyl-tRNA formyltransferase [Sphingomonas sp.]
MEDHNQGESTENRTRGERMGSGGPASGDADASAAKPLRAVLVGAVDSTRVAFDALAAAAGWRLAGLVTLEPGLAGRHSDFVDLTPGAAARGVPVLGVDRINEASTIERVRALAPDFLFVIGWSQLCGPELMAAAPGRVIGYHPAPLPRMRGRAAIPWTILAAEPITAGTLFWIDDGMDSGAILDQLFLHVAPDETAGSLYRRHMAALAAMMARTLPRLAAGTAPREPQDERYATWTARRTPADGRIDWNWSAAEVDRLVRAVGRPYPGAFTECGANRLTIWAVARSPAGPRHRAQPGQVIARDADGFTVMCGDGAALHVGEWGGERPPPLHAVLGRPM